MGKGGVDLHLSGSNVSGLGNTWGRRCLCVGDVSTVSPLGMVYVVPLRVVTAAQRGERERERERERCGGERGQKEFNSI